MNADLKQQFSKSMKIKYRIFNHKEVFWEDIGQKRRNDAAMAEAFRSQPWHSWLCENKIDFTVDSVLEPTTYYTLYVVTVEFEPQQLTYFLLKWPRG